MMAVAYLKRRAQALVGLPAIRRGYSTAVLDSWNGTMVGIHFTTLAYNKSKDVVEILQWHVLFSMQLDRVATALLSTCVVYALFAVLIHVASLLRSHLEVQQDSEVTPFLIAHACVDAAGRRHEEWGPRLQYALLALQGAWWGIMIWLGILMLAVGSFAGIIWVVLQQLVNSVELLLLVPQSQTLVPTTSVCPIPCLNLASSGIFSIVTASTTSANVQCTCDVPAIKAARVACQDAFDACPGMLVGIVLMFVFGIVLLAHLAGIHLVVVKEQDVSERLEAGPTSASYGMKGR
ncbi:hypothetical protein QJQ45_021377 [Haematococcus lacustris]|nr:hypothetical protein QJQ45_021377 [Haematococcus lacustris]